jgi:hypothetical protein
MTPLRDRDEFFIGYDPPLPAGLSAFIARVAIVGTAALALGAMVIAVGHVRLEGGAFEFGHRRATTGTIVTRPYPALVEDENAGAPGRAARRWTLLVAPGKHGADALVRGLDGMRIALEGTRIERAGMRMLEVRPGSIGQTGDASARPAPQACGGGQIVTLRGEIVDSKCFLGVMTPGDGRTHSACASLCLRGGIPPALLVRDRAGQSALYLLEDPTGTSLSSRAAEVVGEPIEMRGAIGRRGSWPTLRTDPSTWTRLAAAPAPAAAH